MKIMSKLVSCVLICGMILCLLATQCFAAAPPIVHPQWDNIGVMELSLVCSVSAGGEAAGILMKQSGVTLVEGSLTVYKLVGNLWVYVDSVYDITTRTLGIGVRFVPESGVQYKAVFDATAYRNTVGENHVMTRIETCS